MNEFTYLVRFVSKKRGPSQTIDARDIATMFCARCPKRPGCRIIETFEFDEHGICTEEEKATWAGIPSEWCDAWPLFVEYCYTKGLIQRFLNFWDKEMEDFFNRVQVKVVVKETLYSEHDIIIHEIEGE